MMPGLWDVLTAAWAPPLMTAQEQYGANDKIARGVGGLLDQVVGFPKRYMETYQPGQSVRDNPEATKWGADMALNMVGMPSGVGGLGSGARVIDMAKWRSGKQEAVRQSSNLRQTFGAGGAITQTLPNRYSIGYLPNSTPDVSHALLSPQGSPVLYGASADDLVRRGFPSDEVAQLLEALKKMDR